MNRVKELDKDAARRALRRAAVSNASTTVDSRPASNTALCHELLHDVLSAAPRNRLTQLCDILAHCSAPPDDTVQQHLSLPGINDDGLSTGQGAWFLPLSNSRSARSCRRASTLDDIDESLYEPVVLSRHQQEQPTGLQPINVWPSDVEDDGKHDAAAENDIDVHVTASTEPAVSDTQTQLRNVDCNDTGKHRSTRSPNSDPAVSLDHQRAKRSDHCTSVAGCVQSDFVLSSSMRPVTAVCPREALCKIRAEGDDAISALNSTVCDKVGDYMPSADVPGDCCQLQSSVKVSSKLNNTFGVLPIGECIVTNSNLTCCRMQQVVEDNSSYCEMIRHLNKATNRGTEQTTANSSQTLQRSANKSNEMNEMVKTTRTEDSRQPHTQSRRLSDSKQANVTTEMTTSRSQVVEKQPSFTDVSNNKPGCSSSPNNVRLLADLITKISELATRQDHLERITPTFSRATTNKSSQTDDLRRQTVDESGRSKRHSDTRANNIQQLLQLLGDYEQAEQSVIRRQAKDTLQSQTPEQKISSQMNNDVSQAKQATHTTPTNDDASEATKLTDSSPGQQRDNVTAATSGQLRPPGQFVERSPLSDVTDNIIHVVRGSSALDDLTVDELMSQHSELRRVSDESVAHRRQPAVETEAHSQPLPPAQSQSPVTNGPQRRYQYPTATINNQDNHQHLSRLHDGRERRQNTSSDSLQQRRDPQTTNVDQTGHRHNRQTPQHADSVSFQHLRDQSTTHGKPWHSPRLRRESKTPQHISCSTSSTCHLMQPDMEQHPTVHGARRTADEPYERSKTSQRTTDDHHKLRMRYVACAVP